MLHESIRECRLGVRRFEILAVPAMVLGVASARAATAQLAALDIDYQPTDAAWQAQCHSQVTTIARGNFRALGFESPALTAFRTFAPAGVHTMSKNPEKQGSMEKKTERTKRYSCAMCCAICERCGHCGEEDCTSCQRKCPPKGENAGQMYTKMAREGFLTDMSCEGCLTPLCITARSMFGGKSCAVMWHSTNAISGHPRPSDVMLAAGVPAGASSAGSAASAGRMSVFPTDSGRKRRRPIKRGGAPTAGHASIPLNLDADSEGSADDANDA